MIDIHLNALEIQSSVKTIRFEAREERRRKHRLSTLAGDEIESNTPFYKVHKKNKENKDSSNR